MDKLEIDIDPLILMPSIIGPKVKVFLWCPFNLSHAA